MADSAIDGGATELFRPRDLVRTRGDEARPQSAVTKVPLFSDPWVSADIMSSEGVLECFELISMTSEDEREPRVALLDPLRGLVGVMIVFGE